MKTKQKRIQLVLISIGLLLILATYFYYPYIKKTYSMKHDVIEIPQMTIGERVAFVESYLSMHE